MADRNMTKEECQTEPLSGACQVYNKESYKGDCWVFKADEDTDQLESNGFLGDMCFRNARSVKCSPDASLAYTFGMNNADITKSK